MAHKFVKLYDLCSIAHHYVHSRQREERKVDTDIQLPYHMTTVTDTQDNAY